MNPKRDVRQQADRSNRSSYEREDDGPRGVGLLADLPGVPGNVPSNVPSGVPSVVPSGVPATEPLARDRPSDESDAMDAGAGGEARGRDRSPTSVTPLAPSFPSIPGPSSVPVVDAREKSPRREGLSESGPEPRPRWRRSSVAGVAGIVRSRVSRAARRSAAGGSRGERDQLELAFEGGGAAAPVAIGPAAAMPYSVISPFPGTPPVPAKPRRLVPLRAVPTSYVVPSRRCEGVADRWTRALASAVGDLGAFLAPPTPREQLQPVLSNSAPAGPYSPELDRLTDRSSVAHAHRPARWVEQIALLGGLLAAIALAWFLG